MQGRFGRYSGLIAPGTRRRWVGVVVFALFVSGLEAVGAVLVFALVSLATDPSGSVALPVVGDLRSLVPNSTPEQLVTWTAVGVSVFFLLRGAAVLTQTYVQARVANATSVELSTRLLGRYLRMPYSFHLRRNSSELIRNANEAVNEILGSILMPMVRLLAEGTVVIGLLIVLLITAPVPTLLAATTLIPLVVVVLRITQPRIGRLGAISQLESGRSIQALQQSLHGFRDITVLGRQAFFLATFRVSRERMARTRYLRALLGDVPRIVIEAVVIGLIAAFMVISTLFGDGPQGSLAVVGLFAYAALRIMPALNKVVTNLNSIRFGQAALDDVQEDLRQPYRPADAQDGGRLPFRDALVFDDVTFCYPGVQEPTLEGINLVIRRSQSVGIVGATGAGKSTLVDLLVALSSPTEGRITVDGIDLDGNETAWQRNLGMVSQQVFLLDDTLRRNIALGVAEEDIDESRLALAVQSAQLREFTDSLPDGLETWVGEQGVRVSGGQRQRVAIARALYLQPEVLVFDEGTSALDNLTEAALVSSLADLRDDHTLITVAHRLSTVQDYDQIVHLHGGRILDIGTFEELVGRSPEFRRLARIADASST